MRINATERHQEIMTNLRAMIEANYGSILKFSRQSGMDYNNLLKCLSANPDTRQMMSVGLFTRVCVGLGLINPSIVSTTQYDTRMGLNDLLEVDKEQVIRLLLEISMS